MSEKEPSNELKLQILEQKQQEQVKKKAVREFYDQQNEKVLQLQQLSIEHHLADEDGDDELIEIPENFAENDRASTLLNSNDDRRKSNYWEVYERFCIHGSFWINVCLFCLKVAGACTSMSLSVITSALDSFLDLISGLIIYITNRMSKKAKNDMYRYPMGKRRMESLGFIIFAFVMATAALQIVRQGLQDIITGFIDGKPFVRTTGVPVTGQFLGFGQNT